MLGEMLWRGNGLKRVPGEGLGLLAIARRNASPADKPWVSKMFETARAEALPIEILEANAFIVQESGASPFTAPDGGLAEGEARGGAASGAKGAAVAEQSALVHGTSQLMSGLRASPVDFGLDAPAHERGEEERRVESFGRDNSDVPAVGSARDQRNPGACASGGRRRTKPRPDIARGMDRASHS